MHRILRTAYPLNSELLTCAELCSAEHWRLLWATRLLLMRTSASAAASCVDICPVSVWEMHDGKSDPVNAEECLGCESCTGVCEHDAITIEED